ncbi:F-box/kelch-repeat protein At5g15710 isoform X2 [Physcomitrium patens]
MTPEEIKSIFQMFCKELTSNDYICIKVGTKKNILLNTHNLAAAPSVAPMEMSGALWGTMPEPLVDLILAHLPIPRLFALRTVCKRWNSLIHSAGFVKTHSQVSSEPPYFVLYGMEDHRVQIGPSLFTFAYFARDASIFCSTTKKWHSLSFSFLPFSDFYLILTSRGLLCFAIYNLEDEVTLGVCNPITKMWRALPPWLPLRGKGLPDFVAMVVDEVHNSYKIIVIEELDLITRVYESTTKQWQETGRIHASEGLPYLMNRPCQAFVKNGFMYCLSQNLSQIAAYDLETGVWSRIHLNVPSAHEFLSMRTLGIVESHGRVLVLTRSVVGGDAAFELEHSSTGQGCFQVWAINDQLGLDIVVVGEVPYQPFDSSHDFDSFNIYTFSAEDHKDALIFSSPEWEYTWVFDLSDGTWHVVPECPRSMFGPDGVEGFPMELRLDISP